MKLKYGIKVFLFSFGLVLLLGSFWWGMKALEKNLEDFFLWKITRYQEILPATTFDLPQFLKPARNWKIEDLEIKAKSAISVTDHEKVLFKKNGSQKLPMASLTKLMTALVVLDDYNLPQFVEISEEAVLQEGERGELKAGEILSVKNLLYIMLIESSNDAAYALSEIIGKESFVDLMNHRARNIGLKNTYFGNSTGLDPIDYLTPSNNLLNYSTAEDLVKLTEYLLENQPLIWEILAFEEFELYRPNGTFHHKLTNTNEFLGESVLSARGWQGKWQTEIIGGKTGWTPEANGCFLLVLNNPENENRLTIYVILGSNNRFEEMKKLINWTNKAYKW